MRVTFGLAERHKDALARVATTGQVLPGDWPLMRDLAGAVNQAWDAPAPPQPEVIIGEPGFEYPYFTPERVAATLALFDAAPSEGLQWFQISAAEQFALRNRGMTLNAIATKIGQYNSGGPYPEGWLGSAIAKMRSG